MEAEKLQDHAALSRLYSYEPILDACLDDNGCVLPGKCPLFSMDIFQKMDSFQTNFNVHFSSLEQVIG